MTELAQQMMNLQMMPQNTQLPSAIFGTAGSLRQSLMTRPPVRIGLWPCVSKDDPTSAMGLMTALAILLERWASIRVYRIFVRADGDSRTFTWEMNASQFTVDEWQLDGLDENVALWGTLGKAAEGWRFALELENDLAETEENTVLEYTAADLKTLFNTLETVANDIAAELRVFGTITGGAVESLTDVSETALTDVLSAMFAWQRDLILLLWGQVKPDETIMSDYDRLVTSARLAYSGLAAWGVGGVIAHTLQPGYGAVADLILPLASQLPGELYRSPLVPGFIALGMFQLGEVQASYQLLEEHLGANDHNLHAWLALADLYLRGGRLAESLDTFQRAIELDVVSATLFVRYANLLLALDAQQWAVKDYVLIDPKEVPQDRVLWEAIEAFEESLLIDPERKDVLQQQLTRLIEVGAKDRFWRNFNRLVTLDHEGHMVRSVIDAMYDFEQVEEGIAALREVLLAQPTRVDAAVNLGALLLLVDEGEQAGRVLRQARQISDDADIMADIDRLLLSADDPDFEARLADLSAIIDAGNPLSVDDVEYLEAVLENVPTFSEGYVLVSKGYLAWKEMDTALDVLLDGFQHIPNAPEIVEPLARLLWESEQGDLALDYLSRGLKAHPNDVPLLSLMGLYLFESEREEEARTYLSRAENLAPNHPALQQIRIEISQLLNDRLEE